jgi:hypothetical protein
VSRGHHRKPRTRTPRLRRTLAGISLAAAAVTGGLLAADDLTASSGDTAWGAPDTDPATVTADTSADTPAADTDVSTGVTVTPLDTAWG